MPLSILLTALTWAPPSFALVLAQASGIEVSPGALIFGAGGALLQWSMLRNVAAVDGRLAELGTRLTALEQSLPKQVAVAETRLSSLEDQVAELRKAA